MNPSCPICTQRHGKCVVCKRSDQAQSFIALATGLVAHRTCLAQKLSDGSCETKTDSWFDVSSLAFYRIKNTAPVDPPRTSQTSHPLPRPSPLEFIRGESDADRASDEEHDADDGGGDDDDDDEDDEQGGQSD